MQVPQARLVIIVGVGVVVFVNVVVVVVGLPSKISFKFLRPVVFFLSPSFRFLLDELA